MKICPRCSDIFPDDVTSCPKHGGLELRSLVDPLIGKTIGRYRLISRIGTGGMSSVYLARHVMIDRLVAIKTLRRDLARDPMQRDRFLREARAVNRINHENIVEISDYGESEDGFVYLVMEYVPGEPLFRTLSGGAIGTGRALHIARQVGSALGRAHQMGVVHRDLKPENILIVQTKDVRDFVKLLDFGIAKIMDAPAITGSQQIFGTPGYIAPEYIQHAQIDGRSDLYSLGVILYEMVTGALPFEYEFPGDLLVKHVTELPIPPSQRVRNVPPALEAFVLRCLAKSPEDRFRDAYHFVEELDLLAQRLGPDESWVGISELPPEDTAVDRVHPDMVDPAMMTARADEWSPGQSQNDVLTEQAPPTDPPPTARPRVTQSYARHEIPLPPIAVEAPIAKGQPAKAPEQVSDHGVLGVKRWRARFDAIRAHLDELEMHVPSPAAIAQAMIAASEALETLETGVTAADAPHRRIDELEAQARDFRSTLGRAIDERAARLSHARGEMKSLEQARDSLRSRRDAARVRVRNGDATEGEADALLWELAAVEEKLRAQSEICEDLGYQLADLEQQLASRNEATEIELFELNSELANKLMRVEPYALAMRNPLDRVEEYVRESWAAESDVENTAIDGGPLTG